MTEKSRESVHKTKRPEFWQSGNKKARALKLGKEEDIIDRARKGFMTKMHRILGGLGAEINRHSSERAWPCPPLEGLKLVWYRISIENNKRKNLVRLKKWFLTLLKRILLFLMSPRDG